MVGVRRELCGSSSPTLLPKQGHLQQAAEDFVQAGLEYLQRRRLHNLPGLIQYEIGSFSIPYQSICAPYMWVHEDIKVTIRLSYEEKTLPFLKKCIFLVGFNNAF